MEIFFYGGGLILGLVVWGVCAYLAATTAQKRGRRVWLWAILGILTGPIALFAVYLMKPAPGQHTAAAHPHTDKRDELYEVHRSKHG
jgi:hypothetical protein